MKILKSFLTFIFLFPFTTLFAQDEIEIAIQRWIAGLDEYYDYVNMKKGYLSREDKRIWGQDIHANLVDVWEEMHEEGLVKKVKKTFHGQDGYHIFRTHDCDPEAGTGREIWLEKNFGSGKYKTRADFVVVDFGNRNITVSDVTTRSIHDPIWNNFKEYARGSDKARHKGLGAIATDHHLQNVERAKTLKGEVDKYEKVRNEGRTFNTRAYTPENMHYVTSGEKNKKLKYRPKSGGGSSGTSYKGYIAAFFTNMAINKMLGNELDDGSQESTQTLITMTKMYMEGEVEWADYIRRTKWENQENGSIYAHHLIASEGWGIGISDSLLSTINVRLDILRNNALEARAKARKFREENFDETGINSSEAPAVNPGPINYEDLEEGSEVRILTYVRRNHILAGKSVNTMAKVRARIKGFWVPLRSAPIIRSWLANGNVLRSDTIFTNTEGIFETGTLNTLDTATYHQIKLIIKGKADSTNIEVFAYDYIVQKQINAPLETYSGNENTSDLEVVHQLKKRFFEADGKVILLTPKNFDKDFDSVGITGTNMNFSSKPDREFVHAIASTPGRNGNLRFFIDALIPGTHTYRMYLKGKKFKVRYFEVGKFELRFTDTPIDYHLEWGATVNQFLQNGKLIFPKAQSGTLVEYPLSIKAVSDEGTALGQVRPTITIEPNNGLEMVHDQALITNEDGLAKISNKEPMIYRVLMPETKVTISAPGAKNKLETVVTAKGPYPVNAKLEAINPIPINLDEESLAMLSVSVVTKEVDFERFVLMASFPQDIAALSGNFIGSAKSGPMKYDPYSVKMKTNEQGQALMSLSSQRPGRFPIRITLIDKWLEESVDEILAEVVFYRPERLEPMSNNLTGSILASSTFKDGTEGWTIVDNGSNSIPELLNGSLHGKEGKAHATWLWSAPAKYLGNQSKALGGTLSYDIKQKWINSGFMAADLILIAGEKSISIRTNEAPDVYWKRYEIPLDTCVSWISNQSGRKATREQILNVLSKLDALMIRGEYRIGEDECQLDNVVLRSGVSTDRTLRIFNAVPETNSADLKINTVNALNVTLPHPFDQTPYLITDKFEVRLNRKPFQQVLVAGKKTGEGIWYIDNFVFFEIESSTVTHRFICGEVGDVTYKGQSLPKITSGFHVPPLDLTEKIPANQAVKLSISALDYGVVGGVGDAFLIVKSPAKGCVIKIEKLE